MKSILLSIQPQWVAKILNGEKTIEIRKKFPKDYVGWVYIYCTKGKTPHRKYIFLNENNKYGRSIEVATEWGAEKDEITVNAGWHPYKSFRTNGKVVARFWCDKVEDLYICQEIIRNGHESFGVCDCEKKLLKNSCLSSVELFNYLYDKSKDNGFGVYYDDKPDGYAIHISKLEVFDKPRELSEFTPFCKGREKYGNMECVPCRYLDECHLGKCLKRLTKAPQNFVYIESEN